MGYSSEQLRQTIRGRKGVDFKVPEEFDARVTQYWLKRARRTADKLSEQLFLVFNDLINQMTFYDHSKLPKKVVREVRACQHAFRKLETAMFDGID